MASDSFVGDALAPSPYQELRTKYEELRAWTDVAVELAGFKELSAAYDVLRTKHDQQGTQ